MFYKEFNGINSLMLGTAKLLLKNSIKRVSREKITWEIPHPVCLKLTNPTSRWITLKERKWNYTLPYAESLWLSSGRNDLEMISYYLPRMEMFSDDKKYLRGGYGPRLRAFNGNIKDYKFPLTKDGKIINKKIESIDQFKYIEKCFSKDIYTRQAIIYIGDPPKDFLIRNKEKKATKDFPCTCSLHFIVNNKKLDLIVHMRSNDFLWGATGINIFNYTFIQEFFSKILNIKLGNYYHLVNNLHFYDEYKNKIETLASITTTEDPDYKYENFSFNSLDKFDNNLKKLVAWEEKVRKEGLKKLINFSDDFFNDWAKILFKYSNKEDKTFYKNPILNQLQGINHG